MITKTSISSSLALASAASLLALFNPTAANALSFTWSFIAGTGSSGQAGQTISGKISGLVEGSNDGSGLTVTVDSTPTGDLLGGGWTFQDTGLGALPPLAFTVSGGSITFADAFFYRAGGNEALFFGGFGGYNPQLVDFVDSDPNWISEDPNLANSFALIPEPSSVVALLGLGMLGLAASKLKR
jgi:hypothetical protein